MKRDDSKNLIAAVERALEREQGREATVVSARPVGGGCINAAQVLEVSDGRRFFLKSNAAPLPGMFEREAEGLAALAEAAANVADELGEAAALRVPRPIATGGGAEEDAEGAPPFLLLDYIEPGAPRGDFFERFGRAFATLHRLATAPRFGFERDNYLGSTPQPNAWSDDWVAFWRERRLGHQLRLARENGHGGAELQRLGERLLVRLDELLGQPSDAAEPPALLHGDLWSGNYLADAAGAPVLIDPAAYYGRREADLAMTQLFGGFDRRFYDAYAEAWPLAPGSEARLDIYKLYHLLNHLNLFGGSYLDGCLILLRRYAR